MTTRSVARAKRLRFIALMAAALATAIATARGQDFALECDAVAGILSLRLTGPDAVAVRGRALDDRTWVYEIDDPAVIGLRPGSLPCVAAESVRVLPGYLLGTQSSRVVVTHAGGAPRSHSQAGRQRLMWLPEPRPDRSRPAPETSGAPEPSAEPMRASRDDEERRRLEAEVRAQREENARLRERLQGDAAAAVDMSPTPSSPTRSERKQAARTAKQDRRETARRQEPASRREPAPAPARQSEPPPAREPAVVAEAPRARVVVGEPSSPAPTPRALPPDYAAFTSASTLLVTIPTDLKDGPGRRFRTLRRLSAGERVAVSGRAGDWYRVGGGEGWAFATYLEASASGGPSGPQLGVVQEVTVPVHEGPGGQHAVVAELYRGQQVVVDELNDEWAHVRNGGWVRRSALGALTPGQGSSR